VIIGGAEDQGENPEILSHFLQLCGGEKAHIAVVTCASEFPEQIGREYAQIFKRLAACEVEIFGIHSRDEALSMHAVPLLRRCSGVFFTGGCQDRICTVLGGTAIEKRLKDRYRRGLVIGGTSAGAAVMSDMMIAGGDSQTHPSVGVVELGYGLGLINDVVIDQHFAQRGRLGRLLSAVAQHPRHIGLGIDEDTALVVQHRLARVIGRGAVTIIDMHAAGFSDLAQVSSRTECLALWNVRLHVLPAGFGFDLKARKVVKPKQ
jgi:cyanophycinase